MSSPQASESKKAMEINKSLAQGYYRSAIPTMQMRRQEINRALAQGEPEFLKSAFASQRAGLTEGMTAQGDVGLARQTRGAAGATAGGNPFASLHPAEMGSQLANALYGSKFAEGQGNIDQSFNLMSMAMGGAGQAGSGALDAAGNQLRSIGFLPNYNQTYASILGAANLAGAGYGAWQGAQGGGGLQPVPQAWGLAGVNTSTPS